MTTDYPYGYFIILDPMKVLLDSNPDLEYHPDIYIGQVILDPRLPPEHLKRVRVAVIPENDVSAKELAEIERIAATWRERLNEKYPGFSSVMRSAWYHDMKTMKDEGLSYQQIADQVNEQFSNSLWRIENYRKNPGPENRPFVEDLVAEDELRALGIVPSKLDAIRDGTEKPFTRDSLRMFMARCEKEEGG